MSIRAEVDTQAAQIVRDWRRETWWRRLVPQWIYRPLIKRIADALFDAKLKRSRPPYGV